MAFPVLAAIFLSNLPEGIGGAVGMRILQGAAPPDPRALVARRDPCAAAAGLGYVALDDASGEAVALAPGVRRRRGAGDARDPDVPQANHKAGPASGLLTVLGFALAYLLSTL